ncbi:hypothetical protein RSOLAG22IIIB_10064 [Rhizoctonia solani]|uniref:H-type lectin domain-containing protein n=1 Tax=Rhizoctonia solani TaxID=456999 RepID=A0A0K6G0N3_9AGAM|nr:hypothetical protein RSOLAG22IIIB_10064 [Rhizoctonia solani]
MINSSFRALWNTWSKTDGDTAAKVLEAFGVYFWQIFNDHMKPSRSSSEPWRSELVDAIMRSDILELIFQVALKFSDSQRRNTEQITKDRIKGLFDSMIIFWEKAVDYTPGEYFEQKLIESGTLSQNGQPRCSFHHQRRPRLDQASARAPHEFTTAYPATNFALGINAIDYDKSKNVHIKSYFDTVKYSDKDYTFTAKCRLDAWGDSIMYSAGCTWLGHFSDRAFQGGIASVKPSQEYTTVDVTFKNEYATVPKVVCWLRAFDLDKGGD